MWGSNTAEGLILLYFPNNHRLIQISLDFKRLRVDRKVKPKKPNCFVCFNTFSITFHYKCITDWVLLRVTRCWLRKLLCWNTNLLHSFPSCVEKCCSITVISRLKRIVSKKSQLLDNSLEKTTRRFYSSVCVRIKLYFKLHLTLFQTMAS